MFAEKQQNVSWYMLERYTLGQLPVSETKRVDQMCELNLAINKRYDAILTDNRPMPAFTPREAQKGQWLPALGSIRELKYSLNIGIPLAVGIGIAILIGMGIYFAVLPDAPSNRPGFGMKGGEIAVQVVRNRNGISAHEPTTFSTEDLFQFYITTPVESNGAIRAEVIVFQGNKTFFPFNERLSISPGNTKGLPGSLQFSGDEVVQVCISTGNNIPPRAHIRKEGFHALPDATTCVTLHREK